MDQDNLSNEFCNILEGEILLHGTKIQPTLEAQAPPQQCPIRGEGDAGLSVPVTEKREREITSGSVSATNKYNFFEMV